VHLPNSKLSALGLVDYLIPPASAEYPITTEAFLMANSNQRAEARQMWWCAQSGRQDGPMSLGELKDKLLVFGPRDAFVWRVGFDDWKRVEDVPEVMRPRSPPHDAAWRVAQYAAFLAAFFVTIMNYHPHGTPNLTGDLLLLAIGIWLMRRGIRKKQTWLTTLGIALMMVLPVLTEIFFHIPKWFS
jgi:hypothetical protein